MHNLICKEQITVLVPEMEFHISKISLRMLSER